MLKQLNGTMQPTVRGAAAPRVDGPPAKESATRPAATLDHVALSHATAKPNPEALPQEKTVHGLAAVMSFILPGLGQAMKGQFGKAAIAFLGFVAALVIFPPLAFAVSVWSIYDAYNK